MSARSLRFRRRAWWWAVILIGGPLLLLGGFTIWFAAALSGGFDDLLSLPGPEPDDPQVVRAAEHAAGPVQEVAADANAALTADLAAAGLALVPQAASEAPPLCRVGQHNFKIDDDYDLSCSRGHVQIYTADTQAGAGVPAARPGQLKQLRQAGWSFTRHAGSLAAHRTLHATQISNGQQWSLRVHLLGATPSIHNLGATPDSLRLTTPAGAHIAAEQLVADLTQALPDEQGLVLSVDVEYFRA